MATLHGWRHCPRWAADLDLTHFPARVECHSCGFVGYANSEPCACALVEDEQGRALLGRRAVPPEQGLWDAELRWFAPSELPGEDELAVGLLPSIFEAWQAS